MSLLAGPEVGPHNTFRPDCVEVPSIFFATQYSFRAGNRAARWTDCSKNKPGTRPAFGRADVGGLQAVRPKTAPTHCGPDTPLRNIE